jgi:hypothetical protein
MAVREPPSFTEEIPLADRQFSRQGGLAGHVNQVGNLWGFSLGFFSGVFLWGRPCEDLAKVRSEDKRLEGHHERTSTATGISVSSARGVLFSNDFEPECHSAL